jgi:flagellin
MRINNNLMAMNTHRQMGITQGSQTKSMEKLSSGYRINRAGDDAAGLAISEKMRAQIKGLNQASRNSQDAISLVQTAEGALNETQNILQRMRELAVQSANDTNVDADRTAIQNEISQLTTEIDRIGNTTEFNTRKLLNGGANVGVTSTTTAVSGFTGTGDTVSGTILSVAATAIATADSLAVSLGNGITATTSTFTAATGITVNGVSFSFGTSDTLQDALDNINNASIGVTASYSAGTMTLTSADVGSASDLQLNMTVTSSGSFTQFTKTEGVDATITLTAGVNYSAKGNDITITSGNAEGLSFTVNGVASAGTTLTVDSNGTLTMQIGANEGQELNIGFSDMRAVALGVNSIDISTASNASNAITTVNDAITKVSDERAKLGAVQNRLEHTIANLDTSAENLQASESRIRDVDMAKEMMEFTKNNILQQAAQSMLAQANQAPQGVLQLLR